MRSLIFLLFFLATTSLAAQLKVTEGASAGAKRGLKGHAMPTVLPLPETLLIYPSLAPAAAPKLPAAPAFDFSKTAPHLAFFCRLEINDKAGGIIPAKFRLGAHRYWQDELFRR